MDTATDVSASATMYVVAVGQRAGIRQLRHMLICVDYLLNASDSAKYF